MLGGSIRAMRPHQWVKNLFVLVPIVFAKELADGRAASRVLAAFLLFSLAASAVYVLNDLEDVEADRLHPKKRTRPIASGEVSVRQAKTLFTGLVLVSTFGSLLVTPWLTAIIGSYLMLNIAYTLRLKRVAYLDVLCIATGFELRVLAGTVAADVPPTDYLLAVTFVLACFLGFGKRMHELAAGANAAKQRAVLSDYGERTLRLLLSLTGIVTIVLYALWALDDHTLDFFGTDLLVYTTVFTAIGVGRFLRLVTSRPDAESPTEEMLHDPIFLGNLVAWALTVVAMIYFSPSLS